MKKSEPANYQSYLLRLRRNRGQNSWKIWLQSTATERVFQFDNAHDFWEFLNKQMGIEADGHNPSTSKDG